ncbi:MAG: DUF2723 domain-containing protein, partial [Candidatus Eisenbacteria bacterium]|nr:DUF2723 domain-containing protein [Candidatus Eisenbacteria bacterium]
MRLLTSRPARRPWLAAGFIFACAAAVYCATAARVLRWGDGAEFVAAAHTLGIAHPPGYPLYTLVSALAVRAPFGTPFFRMSLLSGVFGAAAAAVVGSAVWNLSAAHQRQAPASGGEPGDGASIHVRFRGGPTDDPQGGLLRAGSALFAGFVFAF